MTRRDLMTLQLSGGIRHKLQSCPYVCKSIHAKIFCKLCFVRGLSKRAISECVHRARCCLTQWVHPTVCLCFSDTVESLDSVSSPVPVKSNNSISDGLWYSSRRLDWMLKRFKKQFGKCKELDHVSAAECRGATSSAAHKHTWTRIT